MIHLLYFPEQYVFFFTAGYRSQSLATHLLRDVDLPRRQTGEELSNEEALERLLQERHPADMSPGRSSLKIMANNMVPVVPP